MSIKVRTLLVVVIAIASFVISGCIDINNTNKTEYRGIHLISGQHSLNYSEVTFMNLTYIENELLGKGYKVYIGNKSTNPNLDWEKGFEATVGNDTIVHVLHIRVFVVNNTIEKYGKLDISYWNPGSEKNYENYTTEIRQSVLEIVRIANITLDVYSINFVVSYTD